MVWKHLLFFAEILEPLEESNSSYNYWTEFFNMLLTLAFILALVLTSVWFLKRFMRNRFQILNRGTHIKILEKRPLNPKSFLYIVDICGKIMVIAESPAGIRLITELDSTANLDALYDPPSPEPSPLKEGLSKKLKSFLSGPNRKKNYL